MKNVDEKYSVVMTMPQLIKKKYDKTVGRRLAALSEKLLSCIINPSTVAL